VSQTIIQRVIASHALLLHDVFEDSELMGDRASTAQLRSESGRRFRVAHQLAVLEYI